MKQVKHWPALPLIGLIRLYQKFVSPAFPPSCRYYPCCSAYAVTALRHHGLWRGGALMTWRLLRCNPWSRGGVDHVPVAWPAPDRRELDHHQTEEIFHGLV